MKKGKLKITIESSLFKEINNYPKEQKILINRSIVKILKNTIAQRKLKDLSKDPEAYKVHIRTSTLKQLF